MQTDTIIFTGARLEFLNFPLLQSILLSWQAHMKTSVSYAYS